ncbi:MAG: TonB-dependent receptor [Acidobacteriota bacterium]|nr:TonB-dependent receptor [Acidobacteriota bacterium]
MKSQSIRWLSVYLIVALTALGSPGMAQDTDEAGNKESEEKAEEMEEVKDVIVVTASRSEQLLHEVPAAMTVLTADQIENIPADDYGDFLRNVPGLNVSQMSARDIQITGRGSTNSLAATELVLLDNRTLYLDFFGFVMWDYVPLDPKEIKQIEVVRGPGSAVWGANAVSGVINLITKRPREMQGTSVTLGAGDFSTLYGSITHAAASDDWGFKLTGSYFEQDPYDRPTGIIPGTVGPTNPAGTPYIPFENKGTTQPKFNFAFDYDKSDEVLWKFGLGHAATDGIIHSGIGPFDISSGSAMDFVKVDWSRRAQRATFFVNLLDGDALNLAAFGPDGELINFFFESQTYNLDYSDTRILGENNILTFGGTVRQNDFDLSIAPAGDSREEKGLYLQDEILIGDKARWLIGARIDDIDPIDGEVVSPRTSLLLSPKDNHTFRLSFNRAFQAPSLINNFLDLVVLNQAQLPPIPAFGFPGALLIFPSAVGGNVELKEQRLDAIEAGYVGTFGATTFTASVYRNETTDSIDFYTAAYYDSNNPPPGWPLPPFVPTPFGLVPTVPEQSFPSFLSYRNIGETIDEGVELSLDFAPRGLWSGFVNYSYQQEPEVSGIDRVTLPNGTVRDGVNTPPENRMNAGLAYDTGKFFFNTNVNHVDEAFWTDVLDARFWGPTDSFTQVNIGAGVRFNDDNVTLSLTGQNVFDEDVLQHIFGDLIARKLTGQILFRF